MNDTDFVAAESLEEAEIFYMDQFGTPRRDRAEYLKDPHEASNETLKNLYFIDDKSNSQVKRTCAEELQRLFDANQVFPCFFGGVDW